MDRTDPYSREFKKAKLLAAMLLVAAPVIYLIVAALVRIPAKTGGEYDMLFYILLLVGISQPAALSFVERSQIASYRRSRTSMNPAQLFSAIIIVKAAFVEAIYIYGLVVYFLCGDVTRMLVFYPVGMVWSYVVWPRQSSLERFKRKVAA